MTRCFAALWGALAAGAVFAQAPAKVDFRRDVQPIFQAHCVGCHGPTVQSNGLRLDRRRDAMKGGTGAVIGQGNSAGSRLYLKLIGTQFGPQMPPTGALEPEQIAIIKNWIDQGAEWPDDAAGDASQQAPDPKATRMMDALRNGDREVFQKLLREDPKTANRKGVGGSTPLMYAARYGDADCVRRLLEAGADPNARNESGVTALMWALADAENTRLLLEHKADPNARSENARTPLLIATSQFGSAAIVGMLLEAGANPNGAGLRGATPLGEASVLGDEAVFRLLVEHGADAKKVGGSAITSAMEAGCTYCFDTLIQASGPQVATQAAFREAPPGTGDATRMKVLLDHGVDAKAVDFRGRTLLMAAASSDALPADTVQSLIERGADVNAQGPTGATALDFARLRGHTQVVDVLLRAGAKPSGAPAAAVLKPEPATSVRAAIVRSLPLLQQVDSVFLRMTGCLSCHNNSLNAMTVVAARRHGIPVDTQMEAQQVKRTADWIENWRDRVVQGIGIPGDVDTTGYVLVALAAENYPPDAATDALAHFLKTHQAPDGRWRLFAYRPPLESHDIEVTAMALRSLQIYAPKPRRSEYDKAIQLAANWLVKAEPKLTEERTFHLLGLQWAGVDKDVIHKAAREFMTEQRPDGGWAQIPSIPSDAYATGQALVALREAGALKVTDAAYQRGVEFLRTTQLGDGTWYVRTRAVAVQPYFESGFPHGVDQFISAAATNWAVQALVPAASRSGSFAH
jgi:ankyrin repeat protein